MEMKVIGHVHSCYGEKFGVPRQPGIVEQAWGELVFEPEFQKREALRELEGFSHLWLIFLFHQSVKNEWKSTVRPPRLGGNERIGVFASRSPFRPNPIGLSAVKLDEVDLNDGRGPVLRLRGVDLVDGTPILDIKPYIPYADAIPDAAGGYVNRAPESLKVKWQVAAADGLEDQVKQLIEATLAADPRPAYQHKEQGREYGCLISGYNVRWEVVDDYVLVHSCSQSFP